MLNIIPSDKDSNLIDALIFLC